MEFKVLHQSTNSKARIGKLSTDHGTVDTPVFMPVGTQGGVKTLSPIELQQTGSQIILNNTYHLNLRPGPDVVKKAGGSHKFISWPGAILTDSGGFQVFSLSDLNTITDEGVRFQSHLDGSFHYFTPKAIIEIQKKIGADIIMPLDYPIEYPAEKFDVQTSNRITIKWAVESKKAMAEVHGYYEYTQSLFGIVQGGIFKDLRKLSAEEIVALDFAGYSIGGLSVGEPKELLYEFAEYTADLLPDNKPKYLMGVGKPEDIIECIGMGIDMFDCVLPTRVGRNGWAFTRTGRLVIKNARYKEDFSPLDDTCECYTCATFERSYLRHLFNAGESLGPRLTSLHNITFYQRITREARKAISENNFISWKQNFLDNYNTYADELNED